MDSTDFRKMCRDVAASTASNIEFSLDGANDTALLVRKHPSSTRPSFWMYIQSTGPWGDQLRMWREGFVNQQPVQEVQHELL